MLCMVIRSALGNGREIEVEGDEIEGNKREKRADRR